MEKKLEIVQHVNLYDEAFFILYQWVNRNGVGEIAVRSADDMDQDINTYKRRFEILSEIFRDVAEQFKDRKERIDYYFKERSSDFSTFASLSLLYGVHRFGNKPVSYQDRIKNMDELARIREYADIISDHEADNIPLEELQSFSDLIRYIENCPYDNETKWEAIRIYHNQETNYQEVSSLLAEVMKLLTDRYAGQIADLEEEFYEYWCNHNTQGELLDTMMEKLKINWESEKKTVIVPLLFLPYAIVISVTEPEFCENDIIRMSVMIDSKFILTEKKLTKEDILNSGKVFSDKSKVDIMEFIGKKPCYGKEIAKELNLTTATISYHVSTLLQYGFIKADVDANKIFYQLDKDKIAAYLEDMKEFFEKL